MLTRHLSMWLFAGVLLTGGHPGICAAEQPLVIDLAQSRVEIAVKATVDSFVAKLTRYEASIMLAGDGSVTSARFAFHFRDIETGKEARDRAMHKWQQTDVFPDGLFVLSSLESANDNTATAFGRLTFHGVTRDIRFPVSLLRDGPRLSIDGDATIDTREFGLPVYRMLAVLKVDPIVHVRFHLQGNPSSNDERDLGLKFGPSGSARPDGRFHCASPSGARYRWIAACALRGVGTQESDYRNSGSLQIG